MTLVLINTDRSIEEQIKRYFKRHQKDIHSLTNKGVTPTVWFDAFLVNGFNQRFIEAHSGEDFEFVEDDRLDLDTRIQANRSLIDIDDDDRFFSYINLSLEDSTALQIELDQLKSLQSLKK